MALVTVRSPSVAGSPQCSNSDSDADDEDGGAKNGKSECFFAGKGTALVLSLKDVPQHAAERRLSTDSTRSTNSTQSNNSDIQQHLQSMFYLLRHEETLKMAVKLESQRPNRTRYLVIASRCCYRPTTAERKHRTSRNNISARTSLTTTTTTTATITALLTTAANAARQHTTSIDSYSNSRLQQTEQQLSSDITDPTTTTASTLTADVSATNNITNIGEGGIEESCLLGIDCNERATIGLVVPILADTTIRLDGDGGFSVKVYDKTHIFKPVSVQAMWSALQTLHKVSQKARENNFYFGGPSHDWLSYYESRIESDQSCLNEWHAMDSLESRRPPSPDAIRNKPTAKEETESVIKMKLKEIMMSVDLDEVTSKYIRSRLEEHLDMDLGEFKEFIDAEMLIILGQMDAPTEIFEHVYLGSEWNASNLEELQKNGVRHILNVTREIDNFFPGMFDYFNVRVYDDERTNLLKHWDNTYRYITRAKAEGSKVLVHCKMGVSRSASVVIAYAMKAYNWEFQQALQHVKARRSCIKPNKNFLNQLETYRGMLDAMKNKEKLQRSKSETNLKSSKDARLLPGSEPTPLIQALNQSKSKSAGYEVSSGDGNEAPATERSQSTATSEHSGSRSVVSGVSGGGDTGTSRQRRTIRRSSSSSPKTLPTQSTSATATVLVVKQQSQSLENLTPERSIADEPKNMRFPGSNGENYSVTQNQVLHIQKNTPPTPATGSKTPPSSVRTIIKDLETHHNAGGGGAERKTVEDRKVLNLPFARSISHDAATQQQYANKEELIGSPVWTSSAKLITQTAIVAATATTTTTSSTLATTTTTGCLPIEQNKKHNFRRKTHSWTMSPQLVSSSQSSIDSTCTTTTCNSEDCNSSSSSTNQCGTNVLYDSGNLIMMRQRTRELPLRNASWGSGDQRGAIMPRMRNSSWSAYDTNRNNNTIYHHHQYNNPATAAIYEGQVHGGGGNNIAAAELITMSYKTAPIPSYKANNTTITKPTPTTTTTITPTTTNTDGNVKRTKQKLEKNSCGSSSSSSNSSSSTSCGSTQQTDMLDVNTTAAAPITTTTTTGQRRTHLHRSSSTVGATTTTTAAATNTNITILPQNVENLITDIKELNDITMSDIANKNMTLSQNMNIMDSMDADDVIMRVSGVGDITALSMSTDEQRMSGNVKILKKNFEARASTTTTTTTAITNITTTMTATTTTIIGAIAGTGTTTTITTPTAHQSLPSSPVAQHADHMRILKKEQYQQQQTLDAGVKGLVHKYQLTAATTTATITPSTTSTTTIQNCSVIMNFKPRPRSYYDNILMNKTAATTTTAISPLKHEYNENRPPPAPIKERVEQHQHPSSISITTTSSLAATAATTTTATTTAIQHRRLQQHGKTHPLSRLSLPKQNFNTAAYNTM